MQDMSNLSGRVLIVDDEEDVRTILTLALSKEGFQVTGCGDAARASDEVQDGYDVVLLDVMLRGASGMELLARSKETSPLTEVILITGYATLEHAIEAIAHGAFDLVRKPFDVRSSSAR